MWKDESVGVSHVKNHEKPTSFNLSSHLPGPTWLVQLSLKRIVGIPRFSRGSIWLDLVGGFVGFATWGKWCFFWIRKGAPGVCLFAIYLWWLYGMYYCFKMIRERQYPRISIHIHPRIHPYRFIILHFHAWCFFAALEELYTPPKITPNHLTTWTWQPTCRSTGL